MQWQIPLVLFFVIRSAKAAATRDSECISPLFFKCRDTSKCISYIFVCDNGDDCGDNSDEDAEQCFQELPSLVDVCKEDEFQCVDRFHCIPKEDYCDGKKDCIDGSDEMENCHLHKSCNDYKCMNGQCVLTSCVCDGKQDCRDNSDELNCSMVTNCNSTFDKYLCANHRCIDLASTCNNIDNCGDDSDESPTECQKAMESCEMSPCSAKCRPTPKGYQCAYNGGHILKNNIYQGFFMLIFLLFCYL